MSRSPTKLVLAMALLLTVWVTVFWMYKPRTGHAGAGGGITYGDPPDLAKALASTDSVRTLPDLPRIPAPLPVAPLPGPYQPDAAANDPLRPRLVPPEFSEYVVQRGDTSFAAISRRIFGTAVHSEAISKANPFVTPDKLFAGRTRLRIPKDPGNIQGLVIGDSGDAHRDESGTKAFHVVQSGETLGGISIKHFGTSTRWKAILDANSDQLDKPERLRPGMKLRLPKD